MCLSGDLVQGLRSTEPDEWQWEMAPAAADNTMASTGWGIQAHQAHDGGCNNPPSPPPPRTGVGGPGILALLDISPLSPEIPTQGKEKLRYFTAEKAKAGGSFGTTSTGIPPPMGESRRVSRKKRPYRHLTQPQA